MAMTALNSVTRALLIDSLAFDAFVDDGVGYLTVSRRFVAVKRTPHMMMMDDGMHPVHVAANCHKRTKEKLIQSQ